MQSADAGTHAGEGASRPRRLWLVSLGWSLIAGLLAGFGGEFTYEALHREPVYPAEFDSLGASERAAARAKFRFRTAMDVEKQKAMVAYGLLGVALGGVLGLTGGRAAGSKHARLAGAASGVLAGLAGAGLSMALVPVFFETSGDYNRVLSLFLIHLAIFAGIGATGGVALSWGLGAPRVMFRCMIGGLIGALIGTFASELTNILAFPLWNMYEPVPVKTRPRLLVHLWVAAGVAVGAGLAAGKAWRAADTTRSTS